MDPEESHILLIGESVNDPNVFSFVSQEKVMKKNYRQQKAFLDLQKLLKHGRKYVSIINGGFDAIESHILTPDSQLDPAQLRVKFFYTLLQLK